MDLERINHIFQFMEYDELSEAQHDLICSFESQMGTRGWLSVRQVEILEDIFRKAAEA